MVEDLGHDSGFGDERKYPRFGAAVSAGQRFNLKNAAQHLGPLAPETPAFVSGSDRVVDRRGIRRLLLLCDFMRQPYLPLPEDTLEGPRGA